jgi:hypothetical protein
MARTYRATVKAHYGNGILIEPSLHYQTDLSFIGDEPDPSDVAGGIWTLIGTAFLACCHSTIHVDELIVAEEVLKPDLGAAGSHIVNQDGTFSSGSSTIPHALAAVVNLHTATRSKSARGWCMMPSPLVAAALATDLWTGTYLTALQTLAALLDNSFDMGTIDITHVNPVVYSGTRRKRGEEPWTFRVTSSTVNPQTRWLKSRLSNP